MSGTRTMKHASTPRHATAVPRPTVHRRILLSRAGTFAKNATLVFVAVVVLFTAVMGLLAITSWATDQRSGTATNSGF